MGDNVTTSRDQGGVAEIGACATLSLTVSQIKAFLAHASQDETRFHLCGVYFDRDAIVAVDGHRLIAAPIAYAKPMGTWDPFLASSDDLKVACKMAGARGRVEIKIYRETTAGATVRKIGFHAYGPKDKVGREKYLGNYVGTVSPIQFPPWRQVVPRLDGVKPSPTHVNPSYLADLCLVADAFNTSTCDGVEYLGTAGNDLDPSVYACGPEACRDVIVVIMPMRGKFTARCIRSASEAEVSRAA